MRDARPDDAGRRPHSLRLAATCALLLLPACGRSTLSFLPEGDSGQDGLPSLDGGPESGLPEGGPAGCGVPTVGPFFGSGEATIELVTEFDTRGGSTRLSSACGAAGPEMVVEWVSPVSGTVFFDTFGSTADTVLYTAEARHLDVCEPTRVEGACSDDAPSAPLESELGVAVTEGETVYLVVDSYDEGGGFVLNVRYEASPSERQCADDRDNDGDGRIDCADPDCQMDPSCDPAACRALDAGSDLGSELIRADTTGNANDFAGSCGGASAADDVVLWTAPFTGRFIVDTRGSRYDTVLYAAELGEDGCTPVRELLDGCNDDISEEDLDSRLTLNLVEGQQIGLVVDGFSNESGEYQLNIEGDANAEVCDNGVDDNGDGRVDCEDSSCTANPVCLEDDDCPALTAEPRGVTEGSSEEQPNRFTSACGGASAPELTLAWTAPHAGSFQLDTLGSDFDTVLSVHADESACTASGPEPLACNDDTVALWSQLTLEAEAGQTYLVVIDGWSNVDVGDAVLRITDLAPPDSESVCDDGLDDDGDGDTDCADDDCVDDDACTSPDVEVRCSDGADDDGDGDIDCADDDCADDDACLPARESECDDGLDDDGDGDVDCADDDCSMDPVCAPPPDCFDADLGNATGLRVSRGSTTGGGNDAGGSCGGNAAPDRLLRWTAPETGRYQFDTFGSQYDTLIYLWESNPSCAPREIADSCNDDARQSLQSLSRVELTAGESVLVVIDGYSNYSGNYNLNVRFIEEDATTERNCFNGIDDDNDRLIDCSDPDCAADCAF